MRVLYRMAILLAAALLLAGCAGSQSKRATQPTLAELRRLGPASTRANVAGRWLLQELLSPGGSAKRAREAREHLDELSGGGVHPHLARALDDTLHGRSKQAVEHYMQTVKAARDSDEPMTDLFAWYAAHEAVRMQGMDPKAWSRWSKFIRSAIAEPRAIGWRARAELVEWAIDEDYANAVGKIDDLAVKSYGCAENVRMAGPFGTGASADSYRHFAAEDPGPWPPRFAPTPGRVDPPRVLKTERSGCSVEVDEPVDSGVFYVETYLELPKPRELILAIQGSMAVWIDDHQVLNRDPRKWGIWQKFGVAVRLPAGRHRVLARSVAPETSMRVLKLDGTPSDVKTSADPSAPYSLAKPRVLNDPNALSKFVRRGRIVGPRDDVLRFVAAELSYIEGQNDVATMLLEPLIKSPKRATGPALMAAANYAERDPILGDAKSRDLTLELRRRAGKKDSALWRVQMALALAEIEQKGATAAVRRLRKLAKAHPDVPALGATLVELYGELSWAPERAEAVKDLLKRFPNNTSVMSLAIGLYDDRGEFAKSDKLVEKILKKNPDSEIRLSRALSREDYDAALKELKRLGKRRPNRKDIVRRIHDVMVRAGNTKESWKKLEDAIEKNPKSGHARLALADAKYAAGDHKALYAALVAAVEAGAATDALGEALDLIEGVTELEPYRLKSGPIIAAYEKSGKFMPGTAARVLDYAAVWVHADGSSRMLSHQVIRIQTAEAIRAFAEHRALGGVVLHMRVIKKDGRFLEPEYVAGKPTVTFPHLEIGDYIETEHVTYTGGDGQLGKRYVSPRWFFREENIAYARSEFVMITPAHKKVDIETRGAVPDPEVTKSPGIVTRRWRVDRSPAAPVEPNSTPITEFLPSVQLAWGVTVKARLRSLADSVADVTPIDPRIRRIARKIVEPLGPSQKLARAKKLYRWILANVEKGEENDGRRVIIDKSGNRWKGYITLCRALGIKTNYVIARNRLAAPAVGKLSEALLYNQPILRIDTEKGAQWLTLSSKYAPFGYVPANVRGVEGYLLTDKKLKKIVTPASGEQDRVEYVGTVKLSADGSAKIDIVQSYYGQYAMQLRAALDRIPERQMHDVLESRLLGRSLRGARLIKHKLENLSELDAPMSIHMTAQMSGFAQPSGGMLLIDAPFTPGVSRMATLPTRQTPLLIPERTRQRVKLTIKLPKGMRVDGKLGALDVKDTMRAAKVTDRFKSGTLTLERELFLDAGRVKPSEYAKFANFTRQVDAAMDRQIRLK